MSLTVPQKSKGASEIIERLTKAPIVRTDPLTMRERGAVVGAMNDIGGGDAARKLVMLYVYGRASIKEVTEEDRQRLFEWVGFYKNDDGVWNTSAEFRRQFCFILVEAVRWIASLTRSERQSVFAVTGDVSATLLQYAGKNGGSITNIFKEK